MISLKSLFGDDAVILREQAFLILMLVALILPFGNALLSPILESLIDPLGASPANIGWLISVFWAPGILIVPLAGIVADRYGRKSVLVPSLVLYSLSGAAISLYTNFHIALIFRFLQGIGWAGLVPIVVTSIGDLYVGPREATAQGLRLAGSQLTGATLSLIAGVLVGLSWQYPFVVYLLILPVAAVVGFWFEEPTEGDNENHSDSTMQMPYRRQLLNLVRQRRVLAITIARFFSVIGWIGFLTYNSVIVIRILGGTSVQAGVLYALLLIVIASSASQAGRVTTIFESRYPPLIGANVCIGAGFPLILFAPNVPVAGLGVVLLGVGNGITVTLYRNLLTGFAPDHLRAGLVSLSSTGERIMATVTPIAMGWVIASLTPSVGFMSALQLAGNGAAIVSGGGGLICVIVALLSQKPTI